MTEFLQPKILIGFGVHLSFYSGDSYTLHLGQSGSVAVIGVDNGIGK